MKVVIVGAGAIGGALAVKLACAGHEVGVVARGAQLDAIRRDGLTLLDPRQRLAARVDASDAPETFGVQDLVVLGVKAHQLGPLLPRLRGLLQPHSVVLPMLNGIPWWYFHGDDGPLARAPDGSVARIACLDGDGALAAALDARHIVGCVVHAAAEVVAPGVIRANGQYRYIVGEPTQRASARVDALAATLREAGGEVEVSARIRDAIWMKLIGNASFNVIAALTRARMDQICANPELLELVRGVMHELIAVTRACGCTPLVDVEQRIAIARGVGAIKPSTLQDVERGRRLEVQALLGAPVELGRRAGVDMPLSSALLALLAELDRRLAPQP